MLYRQAERATTVHQFSFAQPVAALGGSLVCVVPKTIKRSCNFCKSSETFGFSALGPGWSQGISILSLHGRKYTWSSSSSSASPTLVKLDRVFCTVDWEDMFPDCLLQSSASDDSDHCPLILGLRDITTTKRRFHFESFWTNMDGFLDTVEAAWSSVQSHPCPMQTLSLKLKATARALQSWSQKKIGHITS